MSIPAYIKYIGLTALFAMAAINFTRTTLNIIQSSKRLDNVKAEVAGLSVKKDELTAELEYKKSDFYVEEEARNKLGMVRPGEFVFVASNDPSEATHKDTSEDSLYIEQSNMRRWLNLFF